MEIEEPEPGHPWPKEKNKKIILCLHFFAQHNMIFFIIFLYAQGMRLFFFYMLRI